MQTYSEDLREHALRALERGERPTAIDVKIESSALDLLSGRKNVFYK